MKTDPLWETTASTDEQGLFTEHIVIPWDRLCTHPPSIAMACCDPKDSGTSDWRLLLKAGIDHESETHESEATRGPDYDQSLSGRQGETRIIPGQGQRGPSHRPSKPLEDLVDHARELVASDHLGNPASTQITIAVSEPKGVRVISDLVSLSNCRT